MYKKTVLLILFVFTALVIIFNTDHQTLKAGTKDFTMPRFLDDTTNEKPAELEFKNIQVLKGFPASKLHTVMRYISASLGVRCDFCHVRADKGPWPLEKDDKETKSTAREMITMMKKINEDNFEGRQVVNCATCHNGNSKPVSMPPLMKEMTIIPVNKDSLPSVSTILDKCFNAIGGRTAFEKFKTRVIKGELTMRNGTKQQFEIQQSVPDKYYLTYTDAQGTTQRGYNGKTGWMKTPFWQMELDGDDLTDVKKDGEFFRETGIENYSNLKTTGLHKIGDHKAYEVAGTDNLENFTKLYFDTESGFLVKMIYYKKNPFGSTPLEITYDEYKDVEGVKLPFRINQHSFSFDQTLIISEIKNNVPVDESKFEMPAK